MADNPNSGGMDTGSGDRATWIKAITSAPGQSGGNNGMTAYGMGASQPTPVQAASATGNLNPFNPPQVQQPGYKPMGQQGLLSMMGNYNQLADQQQLDDVDMQQFQMPIFMRGAMGLLG